jgi:HEAT repeat protein
LKLTYPKGENVKKTYRILIVIAWTMFFVYDSYCGEADAIKANVISLSDSGKNNKAIDEYVKLFELTRGHDLGLLHKITLGSLKDESPFMRAGGAIAAGQLGSNGSILLLKHNLSDKDMWVRIWTAISVSELGDKRLVPELLKLLKDRIDFVRISAIVSLGKMGDSSIIPDLAGMLKDKNPNVRQMAAIALGKIGDKSAVPYLEKALIEDNDTWARLAAVASLEKLVGGGGLK